MAHRIPYMKPTWNNPPLGARVLKRAGQPAGEAERERKKFYASNAWRRLRLAFLGSNPLCTKCLGAGRLVPATIPHHVKPRLEYPELALDESNLMALCNPCHTKLEKSAKGEGHAET